MSYQNEEGSSDESDFCTDARPRKTKRAKLIAEIVKKAQQKAMIKNSYNRDNSNNSALRKEIYSTFKWSKAMTVRLIELIKDNYEQLEFNVKKNIYAEIADELNRSFNCDLTHEQVDSKWKGLKKQYKKIKEDLFKTGRIRTTWAFYEYVDEILCNSPEGEIHLLSEDQDSSLKNEEPQSSSSLKRKHFENVDDEIDPVERRHREKMEATNRFLDLFEQLINKIG